MITILGVELDCNFKLARMDQVKATELVDLASKILSAGQATPNDWAKLAGKVENAAKVSVFGRIFTFNLVQLLGKFHDLGLNGSERSGSLNVSEGLASELKFWKKITSHPPLKFFTKLHPVYRILASDASGSKWGLSIDARQISGVFPPDVQNACISTKELFAVYILTKTVIHHRASLRILCDNSCVGFWLVKNKIFILFT